MIDIPTLKRVATELIAVRGDKNKLHQWMDAKLAFAEALNPTTALALIERLEKAEAENKRLREALADAKEVSASKGAAFADMSRAHAIAFLESERWRKAYEEIHAEQLKRATLPDGVMVQP